MKKRIIPIIALSIIVLVAITTVIFAVCVKDYRPTKSEFTSFTMGGTELSTGSGMYITKEYNESDFNKLQEAYLDSFNESALTALFNGRLSSDAELIKNQHVIPNKNDLTKYIEINFESSNLPTVSYDGEEITFDRLLIQISEVQDTSITLVKIYLMQPTSVISSYYFQTYGNFYHFFDVVNELIAK